MCDYSLESVSSRPAFEGETLTLKNFPLGTKGFAGGDPECVTCVKEGTKLTLTIAATIDGLDLAAGEHAVEMARRDTLPYVHKDGVKDASGKFFSLQILPAGTKALVGGTVKAFDPDTAEDVSVSQSVAAL